jgi:hypothetical protein
VLVILQKGAGFVIQAIGVAAKNIGYVDGQRTIHKYRRLGHRATIHQLVQVIYDLLRAAHCERGDDHFAATP